MEEAKINPYVELVEKHPCHKSSTLYYWILGPCLSKEILQKKGRENLELAKQLEDSEYLDFMESYLIREGYSLNTELKSMISQDFANLISQKERIKLDLKVKETIPTHSKTKIKQHDKALTIQKELDSKLGRRIVCNQNLIDAIKKVGYHISDDNEILITGLKRSIIIYIASAGLQNSGNKSSFRLDSLLKILLGDWAEPNFYDLKKVLTMRLDLDALSLESQNPKTSGMEGKIIARDVRNPIRLKKKVQKISMI